MATILALPDLDRLLAALRRRGLRPFGPTVRDGAIVLAELASAADLPVGWQDRQEAGTYRLERRSDDAVFAHAVGPHSAKNVVFPSLQRLLTADRDGSAGSCAIHPEPLPAGGFAFLGARACDLAALERLDQVLLGGPYPDPAYAARRAATFVMAVQCTRPADTCFCVSLDTGPAVTRGADLVATEILDERGPRLVVEARSERGAELVAEVAARAASPDEVAAARLAVAEAADHMARALDVDGLRETLLASWEHPQWAAVAKRCLSCGNCTQVCPTCFCTTVEDASDLRTRHAERWRRWDSCFSVDYSYLHGGSVRSSVAARYRQWLVHKLATWHDQFGTAGCVGCGRCIAWCPVGIDLTAEVRALRSPVPSGQPAAAPEVNRV